MIHIILGTKAQLIKMAPLMALMDKQNVPYNYIFTGQHQEVMSDIQQNFGIRNPDHVLYSGRDITKVFQMLVWIIKSAFTTYKRKKEIFNNDTKGIVLVHGDTVSTLLGALIGKIIGLKVGHIESGLRSFNLFHPFPEEITRLITFHLSDYFFAPNEQAIENLKKHKGTIVPTGVNTLYDSVQHFLQKSKGTQTKEIQEQYAIATLHRFENIFSHKNLERIVSIIEHIAQKQKIFFILHKPTEEKLRLFNFYDRLANHHNIEMRPRYDYFTFIKLLIQAKFIISDGGSNQEECFFLGKPIILLRNTTERPDGVDNNCLVSKYDIQLIDNFLNKIESKNYTTLEVSESPSQIILDYCVNLGKI